MVLITPVHPIKLYRLFLMYHFISNSESYMSSSKIDECSVFVPSSEKLSTSDHNVLNDITGNFISIFLYELID